MFSKRAIVIGRKITCTNINKIFKMATSTTTISMESADVSMPNDKTMDMSSVNKALTQISWSESVKDIVNSLHNFDGKYFWYSKVQTKAPFGIGSGGRKKSKREKMFNGIIRKHLKDSCSTPFFEKNF